MRSIKRIVAEERRLKERSLFRAEMKMTLCKRKKTRGITSRWNEKRERERERENIVPSVVPNNDLLKLKKEI